MKVRGKTTTIKQKTSKTEGFFSFLYVVFVFFFKLLLAFVCLVGCFCVCVCAYFRHASHP